MAETAELNVQVRKETGKRQVRRLRAKGLVPAVIYGHGGASISLSVSAEQVNTAIRQGSRIVALKGGLNENAFIREVQWDTYGLDVLHLDFTRVTAEEMLETTIVLECRGEAPGTRVGGTLEQPLHSMQIKCPANVMTDRIEVNVNSLELDKTITVGDLELPKGAEALLDDDVVVVQCIERAAVEDEAVSTGPAEPEVIGRKADDDGEGES